MAKKSRSGKKPRQQRLEERIQDHHEARRIRALAAKPSETDPSASRWKKQAERARKKLSIAAANAEPDGNPKSIRKSGWRLGRSPSHKG